MKKLLRNPWFAAALAVLAILLVGKNLLGNTLGTVMWAAPPANDSVTADPSQAPLKTAEPAKRILERLSLRIPPRDPFSDSSRPVKGPEPVAAPEVVDHVHLSALWSQHGHTMALINGQIHQSGERVGRIQIAELNQDGALVDDGTGRTLIPLGGDFASRPPAN